MLKMNGNFRTIDLQNLLRAFNFMTNAPKPELQNFALTLLSYNLYRPISFNYQAYLAKIDEINNSLMNAQSQQQQMTNLQPRFCQATPPQQQPQQSINHIARARLPRAIPLIQRYNNPGNFQYNHRPADPRLFICFPKNQLVNANLHNATQALANIRLKKLPFYEVLFDVLKPTTLIGPEPCSKSKIKKSGMREVTFSIKLSPEQINSITLHSKIHEYPNQLQIRICDIESSSVEVDDFLPYDLYIRINNKVCPLPPVPPKNRPGTLARPLAYPIHYTQLFKLCPFILNTIIVNWVPDPKTYIIAVNVVKKLSSSVLLQRLQKKETRSSEDTKNYIIKKMANIYDTEVATTSYKVSLVNPLTKGQIKVPVKSTKCEHMNCFDAETFLLMNEMKPTWLCPTCHQSCLYEDLQIQSYFLNIISSPSLPDSCKEIELLADWTWRACEEVDQVKSVAGNEIPINFINLDDSDDENSKDVVKQANPKSSNKETKILKTGTIDLTLSDEE